MNDRLNYARHSETKEVRFFRGTAPMPESALPLWAFWEVPEGQMWASFQGRYIGESPDLRQERISGQRKSPSYKKSRFS